MEEEKKDKGFVIKDRRHFDESGSVRGEEEPPPAPPKAQAAPEPAGEATEKGTPSAADERLLSEISFASFILSLSTTAMFHFGDFPDPVTQETRQNLAAAKQTIDLLSILQEKTAGNLTADEQQLLEGMLYELRMRFVKEKTKK
ncbi:MAG: DUF1844 domain-containing protein [Syntrophales bacterium]